MAHSWISRQAASILIDEEKELAVKDDEAGYDPYRMDKEATK